MKEYQNVTFSFSRDTLRKAKIIAATKDTSVSAIVRDLLEKYVLEYDSYERSRESCLSVLASHVDMGTNGQADWRRSALHERGMTARLPRDPRDQGNQHV